MSAIGGVPTGLGGADQDDRTLLDSRIHSGIAELII